MVTSDPVSMCKNKVLGWEVMNCRAEIGGGGCNFTPAQQSLSLRQHSCAHHCSPSVHIWSHWRLEEPCAGCLEPEGLEEAGSEGGCVALELVHSTSELSSVNCVRRFKGGLGFLLSNIKKRTAMWYFMLKFVFCVETSNFCCSESPVRSS